MAKKKSKLIKRKPGRPKAGGTNPLWQFRMTAKEMAEVDAACEAEHMTRSDFIRFHILKAARERKK